jgi:hypothetical protein
MAKKRKSSKKPEAKKPEVKRTIPKPLRYTNPVQRAIEATRKIRELAEAKAAKEAKEAGIKKPGKDVLLDERGKFAKGNPGGPGRPPGVPNALTRAVKEAILEAGEIVGNELTIEAPSGELGLVGYICFLARDYPPVYGSLLGRVLPLQVERIDRDADVRYKTAQEIMKELQDRGVEPKPYFPRLEQADVDVIDEPDEPDDDKKH